MSNQTAGQEVTKAIANSTSGEVSRMVAAADASKEKRRQLAEKKAQLEADKKKEGETAVSIFTFSYKVNVLTLLN
jgi:hypothetical protein